jgi:protein-S-isoprenylcysteine O-methyltransferase Ste14
LIIKGLSLSLYTFAILSFAWAVVRFFSTHGRFPTPMKYLQALATVTSLLQLRLMIHAAPSFWQILSSALCLGALVMFWSATMAHGTGRPLLAFAERTPFGFTVKGPYRLVRHPFYASYLYAWTGGAIAAGNGLAWIPVTALMIFYHVAACREETAFLNSSLSKRYEDYRRRTKRFVPYML